MLESIIETIDEMADAITGGNIDLFPASQYTGKNVGILFEQRKLFCLPSCGKEFFSLLFSRANRY